MSGAFDCWVNNRQVADAKADENMPECLWTFMKRLTAMSARGVQCLGGATEDRLLSQ